MTKKDYILVAESIRAACLDAVSRKSVVAELGVRLAEQNPRFNYETFKRACSPTQAPYADDPEGRPSGSIGS